MRDKPEMHFAGRQQHVSRYPIPDDDVAFERTWRARGTLRFDLGEPVPYDLIAQTPPRSPNSADPVYQSASVYLMMPRMFLPSSMSW